MLIKLLCCEVLYREACSQIASGPHTCDVEFVPKGLHDLDTDKMVARLQEQIDAAGGGGYDAILLGYGLCNNGVVGLVARGTQLVLPRAHDCITILLGSREKYKDYASAHPGTYYRTVGWFERESAEGANETTMTQRLGLFQSYDALVEQYGEDNAKYVMEMMGDSTANYDRVTFIEMGLECEGVFREKAKAEAEEKGWAFDELTGSMLILRKLIHGEWDDDFLVLQPGETIAPSYDDGVVKVG